MPYGSLEVNCAVRGRSNMSTRAERWSAQLLEDSLAINTQSNLKV